MVKGPCRGKMCDFWARVKIRKRSIDGLANDILQVMHERGAPSTSGTEQTLADFWHKLGVKNRSRLCDEEPDLCNKMRKVEDVVRAQLVTSKQC